MHLSLQNGILNVRTPCKINPFLEVIGRRADGYHDLDTVMVAIDLYDELSFENIEGSEFELHVEAKSAWIANQIGYNGSALGSVQDNLVWRGLTRLSESLKIRKGIRVNLRKSIPVQAGLGGGSSDAAAALVAAQWMWTGKYDKELTCRLASELGSDINFFVEGFSQGTWAAQCIGRGEIVAPFPMIKQSSWILVSPLIVHCNTGKVFRTLTLENHSVRASIELLRFFQELPPEREKQSSWETLGFNRLYNSAVENFPGLEDFYRHLSVLAPSLKFVMSGSGSSFVAMCGPDTAVEIAATIQSNLKCNTHVGKCWKSRSIESQIDELNHL